MSQILFIFLKSLIAIISELLAIKISDLWAENSNVWEEKYIKLRDLGLDANL